MTETNSSPTADRLRMVVIFRADLPMPPGKAEIQFGHAVDFGIEQALRRDPELYWRYVADERPKINYEVDDLDALMKVKAIAERRGLIHALVEDKGYTVFGKPTITCIVVGPIYKTDSNAVTRFARKRGSEDPIARIIAHIRAYGEVNLQLAGDTILLDPVLRGKGFTAENMAESERQQLAGCIHAARYEAAGHLADGIESGLYLKACGTSLPLDKDSQA